MKNIFLTWSLISIVFLVIVGQVEAAVPITSTFVDADLGSDPAAYESMVKEMKDTGIDTIIVTLGDVHKDCSTRTYTDNSYLKIPSRNEDLLIKAALEANLKIFFGTGSPFYFPCMSVSDFTNPDYLKDRQTLISHAVRVVADLKSFLEQIGVSWSDPRISGLYITEEVEMYTLSDTPFIKAEGDDPQPIRNFVMPYFTELSAKLKVHGKPILISPWQSDRTNYDVSLQAFKNLIKMTDVTIIAPQDSLGTQKTTTAAISKEHFRALYDAKKTSDKAVEIWANIETFAHSLPDYVPAIPGKPVTILPAPYSRIKQQIEAARPYVTKMTSWIYQYTMLSIPEAVNAYQTTGWNTMYTPDLAARRTALRNQYLAEIQTGTKKYYCTKANKQCVATSSTYTDIPSCETNVRAYTTPGSTTEKCYESSVLCQTDCNKLGATPTPVNGAVVAGDADRNGRVDMVDFGIWKAEAVAGVKNMADFNSDGKIDLVDFSVWKKAFLNK